MLSSMAWHWKKSRGHSNLIDYHDGVTVEVGKNEFVVSIQTIAHILWERFYRRAVPASGLKIHCFAAFYESVRRAVGRLLDTSVEGAPLLKLLGPARLDMPGKASDLFGQRWTMEGSVVDQALDELRESEPLKILFAQDVEKMYQEILLWKKLPTENVGGEGWAYLCDNNYVHESSVWGPIVDIGQVYNSLTAKDLISPNRLVEAAAKTGSLRYRERPVQAVPWQRSRAQGKGWGSAHLTIGSWQKGQATDENRRDLPCAVPFLVADVDGEDLDESFDITRLLLDRLVDLGAQPADLIVSFTGGRGFHIRIPHGMVGYPIWPRAGSASRVITRFFERLCDGVNGPNGELLGSLDQSLFSPSHLVRAIGSAYEKVPGRRCVAYCGEAFLQLVRDHGYCALDIVEAASQSVEPAPFLFPDPNRIAAVPALESMLRQAIEDVRQRRQNRSGTAVRQESRGIIEAIKRGVRPGEEFAPGYTGRNYAALLYAGFLLTHASMSSRAAWTELERWNAEVNPVPLGEADGDDPRELERVFERAHRRHSHDAP